MIIIKSLNIKNFFKNFIYHLTKQNIKLLTFQKYKDQTLVLRKREYSSGLRAN